MERHAKASACARVVDTSISSARIFSTRGICALLFYQRVLHCNTFVHCRLRYQRFECTKLQGLFLQFPCFQNLHVSRCFAPLGISGHAVPRSAVPWANVHNSPLRHLPDCQRSHILVFLQPDLGPVSNDCDRDRDTCFRECALSRRGSALLSLGTSTLFFRRTLFGLSSRLFLIWLFLSCTFSTPLFCRRDSFGLSACMFSSVDLFLPANFSAPFNISALAGNAGAITVSRSSSGKASSNSDVAAVEVTGTMQGVLSLSDSEVVDDTDDSLLRDTLPGGGALALGVGGGAEVFGSGSDALVFGCGRAALVFGGG